MCRRDSHKRGKRRKAVPSERPALFWPVRKLSQSETFSACQSFCAFTDRNVESGVLAMDYVIDSVIIMFVSPFILKFRLHCLL